MKEFQPPQFPTFEIKFQLPTFEISFPDFITCEQIETQCIDCNLYHCKELTCDEAAIQMVIE